MSEVKSDKNLTELLRAGAIAFMQDRFGTANDAEDRDRWHRDLGLVFDALTQIVPGLSVPTAEREWTTHPPTTDARLISNLLRIAADDSVNAFARSICGEAAARLEELTRELAEAHVAQDTFKAAAVASVSTEATSVSLQQVASHAIAVERAIKMLQAASRRDLYEGVDHYFYVSYTEDEPGGSPRLDRDDIAALLNRNLIKEKWPGCYVLAATSTSSQIK